MRIAPLIALALTGCAPSTYGLRLSATPLDPTPAATAIPLFSAALPRCPFTDVGLIRSEAAEFTRGTAALDGLRTEARRLGGNAVVHVRFLDGGLTGTVIRFTSPDCNE